ncbi:adenosine receptor A2b-like isoform X1 [Actinia tenebrosa]|uniref:Adenosine receptor A2b-like isoform X1 n=1 Tax=Actinia tenebrosa TaxID=6105 RepID=A0A6P8IKF4_ACTTE|nr:adenosine receptor A2b-like isoform X1 [Actinia tenebrosa]
MDNQTSLDSEVEMLTTEAVIVWLTFFELIAILIVFFNVGTILTFATSRNLRRPSVYCLINLAVADLLYGLSVIPYGAYHFVLKLFDPRLESESIAEFVLRTLMELMFLASLLSLVGVPIERLFATFFPFRYRTIKSTFFIKIFAIIWVLSILLVIPYQISSFYGYSSWLNPYSFFIIDLLLLCIIILSYLAIFIKLKLQNQRHRQHQQQDTVELTQKRERHIAKTLFFVTTLSLSTWLPYIIFELVQLSHPNRSFGIVSRNVIELIQLSNSLINPIVCLFRMKDFRKAFSKLICKCFHKRQRIHPMVHDPQKPTLELKFLK